MLWIDAVLEKIGEGTAGERNAAQVLDNLGVTPFGDDAPAIESATNLPTDFNSK